jgi:hypothetical protein
MKAGETTHQRGEQLRQGKATGEVNPELADRLMQPGPDLEQALADGLHRSRLQLRRRQQFLGSGQEAGRGVVQFSRRTAEATATRLRDALGAVPLGRKESSILERMAEMPSS